MTLCSSSKKLETLLPSPSCLRRVSFYENVLFIIFVNSELVEGNCRLRISVTESYWSIWLWSLKLKLGMKLCVYMCFSATLIILFIFQNTADLRQALVQPSRAQPLSTEPWDSSLPTEMTGTSSIPTDSSLTYTHNHYSQHTNLLVYSSIFFFWLSIITWWDLWSSKQRDFGHTLYKLSLTTRLLLK